MALVVMLFLLLRIFTATATATPTALLPFEFQPSIREMKIHMNEITQIKFALNVSESSKFTVDARTEDEDIATVNIELSNKFDAIHYGTLNVTGIFLGSTRVLLSIGGDGITPITGDVLTVTVVREERTIDTVFTVSVAILVSILYVNFGCAMDWSVCRSTLARPIGPAIGFLTQFTIMPLLSYGLGQLLFPDRPELQIGLFFTGISPSGGASNIWTVLLGGNLNLSVTMTTLCTIAAFGTMPFWIFTLGKRIFEQGETIVPYRRIGVFALGLVIPLALGFCIQRKLPKLSRILVRTMKPFSILLIIFIVIFAIVTNIFLFRLFSAQILIAGMALPWLGFACGLLAAFIFKQSYADIKTIAIETGIQNTGVAIFLLRFTLESPADDLTTVVPVSTAIMTPIPLTVLYLIKLLRARRKRALDSSSHPASLSDEPALEKTENFTDVLTVTRACQN